MLLQAYRFALAPTPRQERVLASHVGARRFAFNWGLALVKERLEARARGEDVEVPWSLPALRREWNRQKHVVAPWWRENSKEAYSAGLDGLARARAKKRRRREPGFPAPPAFAPDEASEDSAAGGQDTARDQTGSSATLRRHLTGMRPQPPLPWPMRPGRHPGG